ncbi:hypothetical protein [Sporosarcina psychrophila]|uniref:hypothetical protein n=1 Tax=Sporosarcina psychrophila TaxID=1476 RepID=UPI00078E2ED4|nr:hypothetical protein [Sporosarcina psychrophila]AMQ05900.1 hypothetical protein AZE41_08210 [Sporosarcina psychrophila]
MTTQQTATTANEIELAQQERIESYQKLMDSELNDNSLGLVAAHNDIVRYVPLLGKSKSVRFNFEIKEMIAKLRSFSKKNDVYWTPSVRLAASKESKDALEKIKTIIEQGNEELTALKALHNHTVSEDFIAQYWKLAYSKKPIVYREAMKIEKAYEIIETAYILDTLEKENVKPGKLMGVMLKHDDETCNFDYRVSLKRGRYKSRVKKGTSIYGPFLGENAMPDF